MSKYTPATFQPTIRQDWAGILSYISEKEKSEILVALLKYPSVECDSAFWKETIKPDLDLQYESFKKSCEAKSRGVRNRWDKISIRDVEDMNKISIRDVIDTKSKSKRKDKEIDINTQDNKKFIAPTLDEVLEYAKQQNEMAGLGGVRCSKQTAESFWSNYESNGWVISNESRTPIRDWKARLRQWAIRESAKSSVDEVIVPKRAGGDR